MGDWYLLVDGVQQGPIPESELKGNLFAKSLPADTMVWKEGMENWAKANDVPAFSLPPIPPPFHPSPPSSSGVPVTGAPVVCAGCKSPQVVAGFNTPLCQPCRDTLVKRPLPIWLRVVIGIIGLIVIFSATRLPRELRAAIAFDRGETADSKKDYLMAEGEYKAALDVYPDSNDIIGNLAVSAYRAGDKQESDQYVQALVQNSQTSDNAKMELIQVYTQLGRTPSQ
jgi:hypothetical protein